MKRKEIFPSGKERTPLEKKSSPLITPIGNAVSFKKGGHHALSAGKTEKKNEEREPVQLSTKADKEEETVCWKRKRASTVLVKGAFL